MARVAEGFLETLADPAFETFRQSRCAAGGLEGNERREARHMEFLGLRERFDGNQLAFAENTSRFHVFVDKAFHRENQLVVERRHGFFRYAADVGFEGIGTATEASDELSTENGSHAGRKAAIGSKGDIALLSFASEREFLADDGVVSAEIGKVAARFDGGFGQPEVQTVGDGGERSVMAAHKLGGGPFTAGVERDGADFLIAGDPVYASGYFASAFGVAICQ